MREGTAAWSKTKLKYVARINPRPPALPPGSEVSFVPMDAVGDLGTLRLDRTATIEDVRQGYTGFVDGDVVVAKITPCFENGKAALATQLHHGVAFGTTELHVVRAGKKLDRRWLFYVITSERFRDQGTAEMYGAGGQKRVPPSFVADFVVALPSLAEQRAIADFLDGKTSAIDALIAKKERLIELLQEERLARITQAVTKGLDRKALMKTSGVEWIGQVPRHWKVARVKHIAKLESGHTPSRTVPEHWLDTNDIPWVSLNDTKQLSASDYISETTYCINELGLQNSSARLLPSGVVVFTRDATIGKAAITTRPMAVSQHIIAWVCGPDVLPDYLLRVFYAMERELDRFTFGSTIKTIGMGDVGTLVTPLPPINEQRLIAEHVVSTSRQLDGAMGLAERQVSALREYRQTLITAAVTGTIDVTREVA